VADKNDRDTGMIALCFGQRSSSVGDRCRSLLVVPSGDAVLE
jgi:hypothetical protein